MNKTELDTLHHQLNIEYAQRQRLGGYSADAGILTELTKTCLMIVRHLIVVNKEIAKLKRGTYRKRK